MSFVKKPAQGTPEPGFHKIRITLNSTNVKNLEKVCADLVRGAHEQRLLKVKGLLFIFIFSLSLLTNLSIDMSRESFLQFFNKIFNINSDQSHFF